MRRCLGSYLQRILGGDTTAALHEGGEEASMRQRLRPRPDRQAEARVADGSDYESSGEEAEAESASSDTDDDDKDYSRSARDTHHRKVAQFVDLCNNFVLKDIYIPVS